MMMPVPAPTEPSVRDEQVAQLERAFALPSADPDRAVDPPATRRAAAVTFAVRSGYTPLELSVLALFVLLAAGLGALLVLAAAA